MWPTTPDAGCPTEAIVEPRGPRTVPTFDDCKRAAACTGTSATGAAREHYEAACQSNPRYAAARVLLGVTLLSLGLPEEAAAEWREALAIDPDNKNAKMYLRMVDEQRGARSARGE